MRVNFVRLKFRGRRFGFRADFDARRDAPFVHGLSFLSTRAANNLPSLRGVKASW
jgi:hypothetical protein